MENQNPEETPMDQQFFDQDKSDLQRKNNELNHAIQGSQYLQGMQDENLIAAQLDTEQILEKIQRYLRGDIIKIDAEGNQYYAIPKDPRLRNMNKYGVAEFMRIISMYVTKELLLSNYDLERVYEILGDLGDQLNKFLYCNYEKIGLEGEFKKTKYELIIMNILHLVESTYRRALNGEERENIKTGRIITQSQPLGNQMPSNYKMPKKKWSPLDKSTW